MAILIQNYRGFDINFNPDTERFSFELDNSSWFEKQSFSACKQKIDEFIKESSKFEPFEVQTLNNSYHGNKKLKIIALRKDGRFVGQDENGKKNKSVIITKKIMFCALQIMKSIWLAVSATFLLRFDNFLFYIIYTKQFNVAFVTMVLCFRFFFKNFCTFFR